MTEPNLIQVDGKYFGPDKIKSYKILDRKSYMGNEVFSVEFENGSTIEMNKENLIAGLTDEISDYAKLRDSIVKPTAEKIIALLLDSELTIEDCSYITETRIRQSIEESMSRAYRKFWGKERYQITLQDVDAFLKNGTPSK